MVELDGDHPRLLRWGRDVFGMSGAVATGVFVDRVAVQHTGWEAEALHRLVDRSPGEPVGANEVRRAQLPDVEEGEAGLGDSLSDAVGEIGIEARSPPGKRGAVDPDSCTDVQGVLEVPGRGRRRAGAFRGGCRVLAAGHPEVQVVQHQHGDADVAPSRAEQVGAADAGSAVAHDHDHGEVRIGEPDPRGVGDAAPVEAVEGVGGEILIGEPGAADVGDENDPPGVDLPSDQRLVEPIQDRAVATAGTERVRGLVAVGGERDHRRGHVASRMACAEISSPSIWLTPTTSRSPASRSISRR